MGFERVSLSSSSDQTREAYESMVKNGNEDFQRLGQDSFVWAHEQKLKEDYLQNGLICPSEAVESSNKENAGGLFSWLQAPYNWLFKQKVYPDAAFYEVLLGRIYPNEGKIPSKEELSARITQYSQDLNGTEAVKKLAEVLNDGDVEQVAHIIYQLPGIVNATDENGLAPLFLVAASQKISDVVTHRLMQLLVDHGAKANEVVSLNERKITPLYLACVNRKQWSARLLMRYLAGRDDLEEFNNDAVAIETLISAWGNSGSPEYPRRVKIEELRRKMHEIRALGKRMRFEEGSSLSPSLSSSCRSINEDRGEIEICSERGADVQHEKRESRFKLLFSLSLDGIAKETAALAKLIIGSILGGLFGCLIGLSWRGIVASSVFGAIEVNILFPESANKSLSVN